MNKPNSTKRQSTADELYDLLQGDGLDVRMVLALAGDRTLNARETAIVEKLKQEQGEALYADMLYTLTHHSVPPRKAKEIWQEIVLHRQWLKGQLGRDVGLVVAAHDYLVNETKMLKNVRLIQESTLAEMANTATKDGLTGLVDHATFKHKLREELERQARYGGVVSLVMLDIDHFKRVNDTYGHPAGDEILKLLAKIMQKEVRKHDTPARYGGEEFMIILPEVSLKAAEIFAERVRQHVQAFFADTKIPITISLGVACSEEPKQHTLDAMIDAADKALYAAKHAGRNQVKTAQPSTTDK